MDTIETDRLILRPFTYNDLEAMHAFMGNDSEMTWETTAWTIERTEEFLQLRLNHYQEHDFGVWAVVLKTTRELIGQSGLQFLTGTNEVELVVYTAKKFWRTGIGFESCTASLNYGFAEKHFSKIVAVTRTNNLAAQKLMKKLGFKYLHQGYAYGFDVLHFEILSDEFIVSSGKYKILNK